MVKALKVKQSKRFGIILPVFKKLTYRQQTQIETIRKTNNLKKRSNFGRLLDTRKSLSLLYGGLRNSYLINLFRASVQGGNHVGETILKTLESRLDTVLVKNHIARSFAYARQLISHKGVRVNGNILATPSHQLQPGDIINLHPSTHKKVRQNLHSFLDYQIMPQFQETTYGPSAWYKATNCEVNYKTLEIIFLFKPQQTHYPMKIHAEVLSTAFKR